MTQAPHKPRLTLKQQIKAQARFDADMTAQCTVPAMAGPIIYTNNSCGRGLVDASDVKFDSNRAGADQHTSKPSRMGQALIYRVGAA